MDCEATLLDPMNEVVPLLKHTPSAQDPRVLEAITVQREPLVSSLVEAILDTDGGLRHRLLVGPRGMGKTHVLSLVASRVSQDPRAEGLVVAWLVEDNWTIRTYDKFLAAIVGQVAAELGDSELESKAESLRASDGSRWLEGEEALREALGDRRLVLLAENLDDVFRRIGAEGQARFRAFIENWRQLLILATAPQLFDGVQKHEFPFYGFFAITHLDELTLDSANELLRRVAELHGDAELTRFLRTETATRRLAAIEALAGGHPRIWLLLAGCISIAAIDELVPLFLEALDELTPYYQARLRELSEQQQELVVLLAEAGGALSNRALAERSGIGQNQVATMLRQMTDRGYVRPARVDEVVATGDQRMSFWELREPLMRLCLDVKKARGKPLRMVVEFLRAWYGSRLLDELVRLPAEAELAASYAGEAFRMLDDGSLSFDELLRGSPEEIIARAERGLAVASERIDLQASRVSGLILAKRFAEARDSLLPLVEEKEGPGRRANDGLRLLLAIADESLGKPESLSSTVERLLVSRGENRDWIVTIAASYEIVGRPSEALPFYSKALELEPGNGYLHSSRAGALLQLGHHEEALAAHQRAIELEPRKALYWDRYGIALSTAGRPDEALHAFRRAVELDPGDGRIHSNLGTQLVRMGRVEEALAAFENGVEAERSSSEVFDKLGLALIDTGRFDEAVEAFRQAVEAAPENADYQRHLGTTLWRLDRTEEAAQALERALETDPDNPDLSEGLGLILNHAGRAADALPFLDRAAGADPSNAGFQNHLANALRALGRHSEAEAAARRAIELDDNPVYRFTLAEVQLDRGDVDAAFEVLELALEGWRQKDDLAPGETDLLCRIIWESFPVHDQRAQVVARLVETYARFDALAELGSGLVAMISLLLLPDVEQAEADTWLAEWIAAPAREELDIPRRVLAAAVAWKRDRDRRHLLELPLEQREILIEMLPLKTVDQ